MGEGKLGRETVLLLLDFFFLGVGCWEVKMREKLSHLGHIQNTAK